MFSQKVFAVLLILSAAGRTVAADVSPGNALRARFPQGIPWKVALADASGKRRSELDMVITWAPARSCMGEISDGFRVDFIRPKTFSSWVPVAFYGVAKFAGNKVEIDLTGGTCDAYFFIDGTVAPDGSSSGDIATFGPGGRHIVGRYHANVR